MKNFSYYVRNGVLASEPTTVYKQWMTQHEYDPEHGKDTPTPSKVPVPAPPTAAKPE
jgi:hypothetical protein